MKRLLISFLVLITFPCASFGEWLIAQETDNFALYLDTDKMQVKGDIAYIWWLVNFNEPQDNEYLSGLNYSKHDCKKDRTSHLQFSSHKQHDAKVHLHTYTIDNPKWQYVQPDSTGYYVHKLACHFTGIKIWDIPGQ